MAEIVWTAEAETWLKDIYDYISEDNPEAAAKVVQGIYIPAGSAISSFPSIRSTIPARDERRY